MAIPLDDVAQLVDSIESTLDEIETKADAGEIGEDQYEELIATIDQDWAKLKSAITGKDL